MIRGRLAGRVFPACLAVSLAASGLLYIFLSKDSSPVAAEYPVWLGSWWAALALESAVMLMVGIIGRQPFVLASGLLAAAGCVITYAAAAVSRLGTITHSTLLAAGIAAACIIEALGATR